MKRLLFFLMAIMFAIQGWTQDTIQIGTGTTITYRVPVDNNWNYSYSQQLYTAAEILAANDGNMPTEQAITQLAFDYVPEGTLDVTNVDIYIGHTTTSTLSMWELPSLHQLCFSGTMHLSQGWSFITLDAPFVWDGVSNIIIAVNKRTGSYAGSSYTFRATDMTPSQAIRMQRDDTGPYDLTTFGSPATSSRNNIKIVFDVPPPCMVPSALTTSNIAPFTADISWTPQTTTYSFEVQYKPASVTDWADQSGAVVSTIVNDTFLHLTNLAQNTSYNFRIREVCGGGDVIGTDVSTWGYVNFITLISCPAPTGFVLIDSTLTTTDAVVVWNPTEDGLAQGYVLQYKPSSITSWDDAEVVSNPTTDTFMTLSSLTPATLYNVRLMAECDPGVDSSEWVNLSFGTLCATITDADLSVAPWTDGFEAGMNCWQTNIYYSGTYYDIPYWTTNDNLLYGGNTTHTGSKAAGYGAYSISSGGWATMISPAIESSNDLRLKFWYWKSGAGESLDVYISTSPDTTAENLTLLDHITTAASSYTQKEYVIAANDGSPRYIIFKGASAWGYNILIDDVVIELAPTCPDVYGFSVGVGSNASAIVSWDTASATAPSEGWNIVYAETSTTPFDPSTQSAIPVMATDFPYIISGLTVGSTYTFAMQSACGGAWSDTTTITISAGVTLPYTQDFEDTTNVSEWQFTTSTVNAWFIGSATGNTGNSMYISNDNGVTNSYTVSTLTYAYAYAIIDFGQYAGYNFTFDWKAQGESSSYDYLNVYMLPTNAEMPSDGFPSSQYAIATNLNLQSTWQHASFMLDPSEYSNQVKKLVFVWYNDVSVGTQPAAAIDNISIIGSDCGFITGLNVGNITVNTANVTFSDSNPNATQWEYVYGEANTITDPSAETPTQIMEDTIALSGLTANTVYDVWVHESCAGAEWVMATFTTMSDVATLPYCYSFEDDDPNATEATAWRSASNNAIVWVIDTVAGNGVTTAGTKAAYTSADNGATMRGAISTYTQSFVYYYRSFDVGTDSATYTLSFDWKNAGYLDTYNNAVYDRVDVYLADEDYEIPNTVTGLPSGEGVINLGYVYGSASAWQHETIQLPPFAGTKKLIFVQYGMYTTSGAAIDNVCLNTTTCFIPENVAVANLTTTTADITWTENGADSYIVSYVVDGVQTDTNVTNSPYTFPTFAAIGTDYMFGVRAICGTDTTNYSAIGTFRVPCSDGAISTFPWTDGFENGLGCWTLTSSNTINWNVVQSGSSPTASPFSGSNMARYNFYSSTEGNWATMVTPLMNFTSPMALTFQLYRYNDTGYPNDMVYVYANSTPDTVGGTLLATINPDTSANGWYFYYLPIQDASATALQGNQYIVFKAYSDYGYNVYIDDVAIDVTPNCNYVYGLHTTSIGDDTVSLAFTEAVLGANPSTTWECSYGEAATVTDPENGNTITVSTNPFTITGLNSATLYNVWVRSTCDAGYGNWANVQFTTTSPCPVPTGLTFDNAGTESLDVHWDANTSVSSFEIIYGATGFILGDGTELGSQSGITDTTYQITGLTASTDYDVYVRSNCGSSYSVWVLIPVHTLACDVVDQCTYTLVLNDSYSGLDGWNGNYITISQDTIEVFRGTIDDGYNTASFSIPLCKDVSSVITYHKDGNYPTENSFVLKDNAGVTIASAAQGSLSADMSISFTSICATCFPVTALTVSDITTTDATISWTGNGISTDYILEYSDTIFTPGDGTATNIPLSDTFYTLTGLNHSTLYYFAVRVDCGNDDLSAWQTSSLITACGAITTIPYTNNFDTYGTGTNIMPTCWTKINTYSGNY
ncbi:MAG: fibronectin type III domain-containing protein, partial [Bacteroidales bacterium]|nr:fibronectin type III domain-containing protein [Bacteroidales bacterium]